jgi:hypothetical protein
MDKSNRLINNLYSSIFEEIADLRKSVIKHSYLSTVNGNRQKTKFYKENLFKSVINTSKSFLKQSFSEEVNVDYVTHKTDSNVTKFIFDKKEHKKIMKNLLENCHNQSNNEFHIHLKKNRKTKSNILNTCKINK